MPVVLSHNTALEVLRAIPPQAGLLVPVEKTVRASTFEVPKAKDLLAMATHYGISPAAVHVLAEKGRRQSRAAGVTLHSTVVDELPAESLLRLGPDLLVCGPDLVFVQMSRKVSPVGAAVLGHELCGCYSHFSRMVSGFYERAPLTTVETIEAFMDLCGSFYGRAPAQQALALVRDGSRSPMETVVSCELFLPAAEGGFGFAPPQLNCEVALDAVASQITGTGCCYVDVAYPDLRLGFEYDSSEFHADPARDRRRREALQHMGWQIVTIDLDAMTDYVQLRKTISLVVDVIPRQAEGVFSPEKGYELHRRLLRATRYGLGLGAALFGPGVPTGAVPVHVRA